jgi:hypothetical protein
MKVDLKMTVILYLFWNGFNDLIFSHECTADPAFQEAGAGNVMSVYCTFIWWFHQRQFIPLKEQAGGFIF